MAAILGKKLGHDAGLPRGRHASCPVTVIEAGPCKVTAVRDAERDGYAAVQLAFGEVKEGKLTKAEDGHLKKAGAPPMRHLVEFRDEDLGAEEGRRSATYVTVEQFEPGQRVKVSGVSIGKGFQGGIKRHNFSRGPVSHGSHNVRRPGLDRRQRRSRPRLQGDADARARWATSASPSGASRSSRSTPSATCC